MEKEQVSLLQIADWLVQQGVSPEKLKTVGRNAERLGQTYVAMDPSWRNFPATDVISRLIYNPPAEYSDETGEAPPTPMSVPAAEILTPAAMPEPDMGIEPPVEESPAAQSLSDVYSGMQEFGIGAPPALEEASLQMAPPMMPSMPGISMPGMESFGSVDSSGGYGNNESGRQYSNLPFVPEQNDNYIPDAFGRAADYGGGGGGEGGSGGGGGGASDTYWNVRNRLEGLGDGGSSSYGSGYSGGGGYYDPADAKYPKNKGFSKKYDEEQLAETIGVRPTSILPRIAGDDMSAEGYQFMADLPAAGMLALSRFGTKKKSFYGKSRTTKSGYVIPPKLKQGKYTNALADLYKGIKSGETNAFDSQQQVQNLYGARRNSYVGQQFGKKVNITDQTSAMTDHLNTVYATKGIDNALTQGSMNYDQYLMDQWSEQNLKKKKPGRLNRYMEQNRG